jgi:hypothetical protein
MSNKDTIIVMGNGPSLADVDFKTLKGFDTFGLNSAYRAYDRLDWYPTYRLVSNLSWLLRLSSN